MCRSLVVVLAIQDRDNPRRLGRNVAYPGGGAYISFSFGSGSTNKTAAGVWTAGSFVATPATTNFFSAVSQNYITGITFHPGLEAPSAARAPFIMRPFNEELLLCQRYYEKSFDYANPPQNGPNATSLLTWNGATSLVSSNDGRSSFLPFKVRKRSLPTIKLFGNNAGYWGYMPTPSATPVWDVNAWSGTVSENGITGRNRLSATPTSLRLVTGSRMRGCDGSVSFDAGL